MPFGDDGIVVEQAGPRPHPLIEQRRAADTLSVVGPVAAGHRPIVEAEGDRLLVVVEEAAEAFDGDRRFADLQAVLAGELLVELLPDGLGLFLIPGPPVAEGRLEERERRGRVAILRELQHLPEAEGGEKVLAAIEQHGGEPFVGLDARLGVEKAVGDFGEEFLVAAFLRLAEHRQGLAAVASLIDFEPGGLHLSEQAVGGELDAGPAEHLPAGSVLLADLDVVVFLCVEDLLESGDRGFPVLVGDRIAGHVEVAAVGRVLEQLDGAELVRLPVVVLGVLLDVGLHPRRQRLGLELDHLAGRGRRP